MTQLKEDSGELSKIDRETFSQKVIDSDHWLVHHGALMRVCVNNVAVADDGVFLVEIKTPLHVTVHLKVIDLFVSGTYHTYELLEAPTLTTGATTLTAYNCNRNKGDTAQTVFKSNPTEISGGTLVMCKLIGGANGVASSVGANVHSNTYETNLKPNTTYLMRITNKSGDTAQISAQLTFYEVIEKD